MNVLLLALRCLKVRKKQQEQQAQPEYMKALLDKFPAFDPTWPDDIKAKWFDGFDTFMKGAAK